MNITNRLFTYPVLSNEKWDYQNSLFAVDFENQMAGVNDLKLAFDIAMTCKEIEQLILSGKAEYVIHLECSTTAYREVLRSISTHIEHTIPIGRVSGSFDAVAFVILKEDIQDFVSTDWDEDFFGMSFDLNRGSILAYQNLPGLNITKDYEEFTSAGSLFTVFKRVTADNEAAEVYLDANKIRIGLCSEDYDLYKTYSTLDDLQEIYHCMVIFPALVYVFSELKLEGAAETYQAREWFVSLEQAYHKRGLNFMEEVDSEDKSSFVLAQQAMELIMNKAFKQMSVFYSQDEEDE
ncbi:MAG: hypothetical protein IKG39_12850 [Lachnospiraceae bacterium]|nr:hypothetical protein [Lachnospiraceae bacterium]